MDDEPRPPLNANQLLYGYSQGIFPMAEPDTGEVYWYSPDPRAIVPIEDYKPPKSLRPVLNRGTFEVRIDEQFAEVMRQCAKPRYKGDETWISEEMVKAYSALNQMGYAHSVEAYQEGQLVGGLYGVSIGAAFFGESMFYTVSNASKVAFHYLMQILQNQGYILLDSQYINDNMRRYGAMEIPKEQFLLMLKHALSTVCEFKLPD